MKNQDTIGNIDGLMYPFSSSSLSHFLNTSLSLGGNGYNLQFNISGTSGFNVIAWSPGWDRGNFFDSTGSKILLCLQYSSGTSTSWVNFPASLDSLMEIPFVMEQSRNSYYTDMTNVSK